MPVRKHQAVTIRMISISSLGLILILRSSLSLNTAKKNAASSAIVRGMLNAILIHPRKKNTVGRISAARHIALIFLYSKVSSFIIPIIMHKTI